MEPHFLFGAMPKTSKRNKSDLNSHGEHSGVHPAAYVQYVLTGREHWQRQKSPNLSRFRQRGLFQLSGVLLSFGCWQSFKDPDPSSVLMLLYTHLRSVWSGTCQSHSEAYVLKNERLNKRHCVPPDN